MHPHPLPGSQGVSHVLFGALPAVARPFLLQTRVWLQSCLSHHLRRALWFAFVCAPPPASGTLCFPVGHRPRTNILASQNKGVGMISAAFLNSHVVMVTMQIEARGHEAPHWGSCTPSRTMGGLSGKASPLPSCLGLWEASVVPWPCPGHSLLTQLLLSAQSSWSRCTLHLLSDSEFSPRQI